jgi:hypothetical protein
MAAAIVLCAGRESNRLFASTPSCCWLSRLLGHCRRSSLGIEAPEAVDDVAVLLHALADVVVVADVAEHDLRAVVIGVIRQRDVGLDVLERPVSEERGHLADRWNDAVCADHLDLTRSLNPRDASWAVVDEDADRVEHRVASLVLELSGH